MSTSVPRQDARATTWLRAMLATLRTSANQQDPAAVAVLVRELLLDHVGERARCLYHDPESGSSWSTEDDAFEVAAGQGLIGHVAATGEACCLEHASDDPRFVRESDDPGGDGRSRILLEPVAERGGVVHAILVVARSAHSAAFDEIARRQVTELARRIAPQLDRLALEVQLDAEAGTVEPEPQQDTGPYRAEAVAAYTQRRDRGEVVRLESPWIGWSYRGLVLLMLVGLAYVSLVQVGDHARGPALVRLGGRTEISAVMGGSVVEIMVRSGDEVTVGQPLVRLHDAEDAAEQQRLALEYDVELRNLLRDPADEEAGRAVTSLRAQQERATLRRQEYVRRSPRAGVVQDVRVRVGQALGPGDVLLSVVGDELEPQLVALLPGDERPRLREGVPLRLELDGYPDAPQSLWVEHVDSDVVSPAEARRLLGPAVGEGFVLDGPVVLVRARLPAAAFESKGRNYLYHDGMRGYAEAEVRSTSVIEALVPALERR